MLFLLSSQFATSTFEAVLITDGSSSYAVFIYECGGMEWGGATIGWADTSSLYEKHSLSGLSTSSNIGCTNSNFYSLLAYRLDGKFTYNILDCKFNIIMKSTKVQTLGAYCTYYANTRARKLAMPRVVAARVVLLVLTPTRASSISRHRFWQG